MKNSTSGGVATSLSYEIIAHDRVIYGVGNSEDFKYACYMRVDNQIEIPKHQGTKYTRPHNMFLSCITESLLQGIASDVLFVGLPCDVFTGKKYIQDKVDHADNFYSVDLICHGPTDPRVQE